MKTIRHTVLLTFGLAAMFGLNAAYAQESEHGGHHPENAPTEQGTPPFTQSAPQGGAQGGMMQGMDHDKMMQMHKEHMGDGKMMDHGSMGNGRMDKEIPKDAEQGNPHDH
ncbi:hypothetical protein KXR94_12750 [Stutzerimonas stutzeri]